MNAGDSCGGRVESVVQRNLLFGQQNGANTANALAWSPDGSRIAALGDNNNVLVLSPITGASLFTYEGHSQAAFALAWSPDSSLIASAGADGTVQVWDAATGRTFFTYHGHTGVVNTVEWQRGPLLSGKNGTYIASGGTDSTVQVWSYGLSEETNILQALALQGELLIYRGHSGPVTSLTWAPDGHYIASGSEDGTVQLW